MRRARAVLLLGLAGCAVQGPPPGGPADRIPPRLVGTLPESLTVLPGWKSDVEFRFDEVVSEGSSPNFGLGTGDLERLVMVSPSTEVPVVRWKRNRITVRPREGWKPNTVYRVELLAGVADLRSNRSANGRIISFTTGTAVPGTELHGLVVDWGTQRPSRAALVEAILLPDSLPYRTLSDSLGRFRLGPLPAGEYLVYGVIDQNSDRRRQSRENFDSLRVAAGRDSVGELWTFKHDTVAARLTSVALKDSLSIELNFSQQLSPWQRLPAESVTVRRLPDSTGVLVMGILPRGQFDSTFAAPVVVDTAKARADSIKARADSIAADSVARIREATAIRIPGAARRAAAARDTAGTGPLRTKPPLFDKLYVRTGQMLLPGARYVVAVKGVRSVSGIAGNVVGVLAVPEARPVADSTKAKPDSTRPPPKPR